LGSRHGQGIARAIQQLSDDVFLVDHGSLYLALQCLEDKALELPPEPVKILAMLLSDEQLARLLDELPEPYRTMVWLVCIGGVRIGELLALRWRAADWDRTCFWVMAAVDRRKFYSPKTHRSRRPISWQTSI
jgi:integrase